MVSGMRCDRCKHWGVGEDGCERRMSGGLLVKRCGKAVEWWYVSEWVESEDDGWHEERNAKPEYAEQKMFVQDGSDYKADLLTVADFFCAHFEPTTPPDSGAVDEQGTEL